MKPSKWNWTPDLKDACGYFAISTLLNFLKFPSGMEAMGAPDWLVVIVTMFALLLFPLSIWFLIRAGWSLSKHLG